MKGRTRSGSSSGRTEENRVSPRLLSFKKKGDGTKGTEISRMEKVFELKKEKKRPGLIVSERESGEDLLVYSRRKAACRTKQDRSDSVVCKRNNVNSSRPKKAKETDRKQQNSEPVKCRKDTKVGEKVFEENGSGRKRGRLDVFEYNEDDLIDRTKGKKELLNSNEDETGRSKHSGSEPMASSCRRREVGTGCGRSVSVDKSKCGKINGISSLVVGRKRKIDRSNKKSRGTDKDETCRQYDKLRERFRAPSDEPISLLEKNDVLKVMLNEKKKAGGKRKGCDSGTKVDELSALGSKNMDSGSLKEGARSKRDCTPPAKHKEGNMNRGSATEKQLIREQIKGMLLGAGWAIDYRPRRDKDYQDAVYISPTGTAYWSVVLAYQVLRKQFDAVGCDFKPSASNSPFTPISEEILSKLTRQTKKKIEREMRKKKRDANGIKNAKKVASKKPAKKIAVESNASVIHEEKLSSLIKKGGKSLKVRMNEKALVRRKTKDLFKSRKSPHLLDGVDYDRLAEGRKNRKQSGCALLVRSSNTGENSDFDDFIPYTGKRTLLSWMIDSGTVSLSGKVQYMNRRCTRVMLEGQITRDGIHCGCCSKILTVSKFEIHAGSKLQQPFQNIHMETGNSLLQCQLDAWNKQEESERSGFHFVDSSCDDPNDDTCGICGDGGDLICCDGCPSTFHQSCLDIQMLPPGDWHCPNCTCKICGSTVDGDDITCCPLLTCSLCEEKFHRLCLQETDARYGKSNIPCTFCGQNCRELFGKLQKLLGVKHELEAGFSWTLIQRSDVDSDSSLCVLPQRAECNSKVAVALAVMDECFLPIVDRRSGINLIHNVLYNRGSNFSRLNYSGFYTAILERDDEIISAASIRIHGTQLAEMPFIGTRHIYRRQGMCRRLLSAIESALCSIKVEKLIIPAISELMHTWTVVFGFKPLEESHKQEMRFMNMLVFPGTDLLQKLLLKHEYIEGNITRITGVNPIGPRSNHQILLEVEKKSDIGCLAVPDLHASDEGVVHYNHVTNDEVAEVSGLQGPRGSLYDTSEMLSNPIDAPHGSKLDVSSGVIVCSSSGLLLEFTESATDSKIHSGLSHDNNLEMQNDSTNSPVECNDQSSAEGDMDDVCEVNAEVTCVEADISLNEISANNTTLEMNEYKNDVSGFSNLDTDESTVKCISDLNHQNVCEVESKSSVVSYASHCEKNILHASGESARSDACNVRTESAAVVEPDITQSKDAAFINGFHGSAEDNIQSCDTASKDNFQGSGENLVDHDSRLLPKVPECVLGVTGMLPDTRELKSEVASSEYISQAVREESVEHGCEVVSKSFYATSKSMFPASDEFKSSRILAKSCNGIGSHDVFLLPTSNSVHHGIHGVVDDSGDCEASVCYTSNTSPEPNFQASGGHCNSESPLKFPEATLGGVQNASPGANTCIMSCSVEPNVQASYESNVHDINDEVATVEPKLHALDEHSLHDTSEVINRSSDGPECEFQVADMSVVQYDSESLCNSSSSPVSQIVV